MATEVKVPALGESITEAVVLEWLVAPGDVVKVDQDLVALETDKITVNVPSPVAGVLAEQKVAPGDTVEIGAIIAMVGEGEGGEAADDEAADDEGDGGEGAGGEAADEGEGGEAADAATDKKAPKPDESKAARPAKRSGSSEGEGVAGVLMPAVRRLVHEHDLDPGAIRGTGRGGRVLKEDVLRHLEEAKAEPGPSSPAPSSPAESRPASADEEVVKMSRLRRTIADRLVEAQRTAAILTTFNEIDMTEVMGLRKTYRDAFEKQHGVRLGFTSFFAKAAIEALKAYPTVNAEIRGDSVVYKRCYHIGVAVGGGRGLVVPVIKDADRLSFAEFEKRLNELADKAKNNKLALDDLSGGTFTISNGGVYGSLLSTPILNPPQSGILGLHKIEERPVAVAGEVVVRPMMYVALSYDHRIIDGREAVGFLVRVKECVEDPSRILLET